MKAPEPGWYLVGRHDGTIEPTFVHVDRRGWVPPRQEIFVLNPDFWWRSMAVPDVMPHFVWDTSEGGSG